MENAKPEVLKKTENELVIRSPDGRVIESTRMPDGSFHLKNSDGVEGTFSHEDIAKLVSEPRDKKHAKEFRNRFRSVTRGTENAAKSLRQKDSTKLYPVASIGFTDQLYPNVKSAIENPEIKSKMLNSFTDYVKLAQEGKCFDIYTNDHKGKAQEIIDCILEYPKVIVERKLVEDLTYETAVKEIEALGELRLPFPKITIISGEKVDDDPNYDYPVTMTEQDGTVNLLYSFFLLQHGEHISVHALFTRPNEVGNNYYVAHCILHFVEGKLKLSRPLNSTNKNNYELAEESTMESMSTHAIIAIYMLTIAGGDMYVSAPTPNEVAVNKKRINKGKKPLIEFRLITVDGKKPSLPSIPHGTHASPRLHWRRGHWRTMKKSGKKVWIDPMLVGDEENGKIIKDYAVGHYEERRSA